MKGSLTGAVTSQKVTEVYKGNFKQNFIVYECNGKKLLNCKIDISSRDESRS